MKQNEFKKWAKKHGLWPNHKLRIKLGTAPLPPANNNINCIKLPPQPK